MDYLTQYNTVVVADLELGQVNESFVFCLGFVSLFVCFKVRAAF